MRLTKNGNCYYRNYMKVRLIRIGNSKGIRFPSKLLRVYQLKEGAELEIEERREGLLVRIGSPATGRIPWEEAYREMSAEAAERQEWSEWDSTARDGVED